MKTGKHGHNTESLKEKVNPKRRLILTFPVWGQRFPLIRNSSSWHHSHGEKCAANIELFLNYPII